ncbi:hypothetical protein DASC09_013830 [Saccharomycopsis crataegensis]|uniref:Uncharacterized protein n=1 Tax=Saccharomycopsis crataegensis TaxID=43959 RepID=A0AAV5QH12_9ASCO|nr:hypothetical protein DASC09_013830 [Saccharomycopsis crataegensis]
MPSTNRLSMNRQPINNPTQPKTNGSAGNLSHDFDVHQASHTHSSDPTCAFCLFEARRNERVFDNDANGGASAYHSKNSSSQNNILGETSHELDEEDEDWHSVDEDGMSANDVGEFDGDDFQSTIVNEQQRNQEFLKNNFCSSPVHPARYLIQVANIIKLPFDNIDIYERVRSMLKAFGLQVYLDGEVSTPFNNSPFSFICEGLYSFKIDDSYTTESPNGMGSSSVSGAFFWICSILKLDIFEASAMLNAVKGKVFRLLNTLIEEQDIAKSDHVSDSDELISKYINHTNLDRTYLQKLLKFTDSDETLFSGLIILLSVYNVQKLINSRKILKQSHPGDSRKTTTITGFTYSLSDRQRSMLISQTRDYKTDIFTGKVPAKKKEGHQSSNNKKTTELERPINGVAKESVTKKRSSKESDAQKSVDAKKTNSVEKEPIKAAKNPKLGMETSNIRDPSSILTNYSSRVATYVKFYPSLEPHFSILEKMMKKLEDLQRNLLVKTDFFYYLRNMNSFNLADDNLFEEFLKDYGYDSILESIKISNDIVAKSLGDITNSLARKLLSFPNMTDDSRISSLKVVCESCLEAYKNAISSFKNDGGYESAMDKVERICVSPIDETKSITTIPAETTTNKTSTSSNSNSGIDKKSPQPESNTKDKTAKSDPLTKNNTPEPITAKEKVLASTSSSTSFGTVKVQKRSDSPLPNQKIAGSQILSKDPIALSSNGTAVMPNSIGSNKSYNSEDFIPTSSKQVLNSQSTATTKRDDTTKEKPIVTTRKDEKAKEKATVTTMRDDKTKEKPIAVTKKDDKTKEKPIAVIKKDDKTKEKPIAVIKKDDKSKEKPAVTVKKDDKTKEKPKPKRAETPKLSEGETYKRNRIKEIKKFEAALKPKLAPLGKFEAKTPIQPLSSFDTIFERNNASIDLLDKVKQEQESLKSKKAEEEKARIEEEKQEKRRKELEKAEEDKEKRKQAARSKETKAYGKSASKQKSQVGSFEELDENRKKKLLSRKKEEKIKAKQKANEAYLESKSSPIIRIVNGESDPIDMEAVKRKSAVMKAQFNAEENKAHKEAVLRAKEELKTREMEAPVKIPENNVMISNVSSLVSQNSTREVDSSRPSSQSKADISSKPTKIQGKQKHKQKTIPSNPTGKCDGKKVESKQFSVPAKVKANDSDRDLKKKADADTKNFTDALSDDTGSNETLKSVHAPSESNLGSNRSSVAPEFEPFNFNKFVTSGALGGGLHNPAMSSHSPVANGTGAQNPIRFDNSMGSSTLFQQPSPQLMQPQPLAPGQKHPITFGGSGSVVGPTASFFSKTSPVFPFFGTSSPFQDPLAGLDRSGSAHGFGETFSPFGDRVSGSRQSTTSLPKNQFDLLNSNGSLSAENFDSHEEDLDFDKLKNEIENQVFNDQLETRSSFDAANGNTNGGGSNERNDQYPARTKGKERQQFKKSFTNSKAVAAEPDSSSLNNFSNKMILEAILKNNFDFNGGLEEYFAKVSSGEGLEEYDSIDECEARNIPLKPLNININTFLANPETDSTGFGIYHDLEAKEPWNIVEENIDRLADVLEISPEHSEVLLENCNYVLSRTITYAIFNHEKAYQIKVSNNDRKMLKVSAGTKEFEALSEFVENNTELNSISWEFYTRALEYFNGNIVSVIAAVVIIFREGYSGPTWIESWEPANFFLKEMIEDAIETLTFQPVRRMKKK